MKQVEVILDAYCQEKIKQAAGIDARYAMLWQEIHYYLTSGGKRMRPRLVLLAYEAYRNPDHDIDITPVAAAWELLHACLLVHDDIIDRDTMRHGQPNIAGRYQAIYGEASEHYALSAALLSGDLLLMSAYEIVNIADISSDIKVQAQSYLNKALFSVGGGELIDTDSVLYPISESNPHVVAAHKTASYSLQLPLLCGAALAGASSDELEKLSTIGLHAGIAYQLRDDLLGIFGDSLTTGKSNRSDVIEKKRTFLIHKTLENLESTNAAKLATYFAPHHDVSPEEAEEIVELIILSGAKETVENVIEEKTRQALEEIASLEVDSSYKAHFSELIGKLTTRAS